MILALGPWPVDAGERRQLSIPFGAHAKPTLVMKGSRDRRIQFLACSIQGVFFIERFVVNRDSKISGRCQSQDFCRLFPTLDWPLLGPGSRLEVTVTNPEVYEQDFALAFTIRDYK